MSTAKCNLGLLLEEISFLNFQNNPISPCRIRHYCSTAKAQEREFSCLEYALFPFGPSSQLFLRLEACQKADLAIEQIRPASGVLK